MMRRRASRVSSASESTPLTVIVGHYQCVDGAGRGARLANLDLGIRQSRERHRVGVHEFLAARQARQRDSLVSTHAEVVARAFVGAVFVREFVDVLKSDLCHCRKLRPIH